MPSAVELKSRMQSISKTKKVTDAMYMISSVKMRQAKREVSNTEPYFNALSQKIGGLLRYIPDTQNRYFHTELAGRIHARHGILLITSDKGLAGSYNHSAIAVAEEYMSRHPETVLFIIGEYGRQYFTSKKIPFVEDFYCSANAPSVWGAQKICAVLMEYFDEGKLDEINVIFTDYKNGRPSECRRACLIPLDKSIFRNKTDENDIGHTGGIYHHRDVHLLSPGGSVNIYVDPVLVLFLPDLHMLAVPVAEGDPVIPEIEGAFLLKTGAVDLLQDLFGNLI